MRHVMPLREDNNVSAIFTKLRVADRTQAMLKAHESGGSAARSQR